MGTARRGAEQALHQVEHREHDPHHPTAMGLPDRTLHTHPMPGHPPAARCEVSEGTSHLGDVEVLLHGGVWARPHVKHLPLPEAEETEQD